MRRMGEATMRAVGIDLGTTNSVVALADEKAPRVLPNNHGEMLTPSVVSHVKNKNTPQGELIAGRVAANNSGRDPDNTIHSVKRLMGRHHNEARVKEAVKRFHYRLAPPPKGKGTDQGVRVLLGEGAYTPVEISAEILKYLRDSAQRALGEAVTHAVITVPAYFEERQRAATREAGEMAGLEVLEIIDEPTAAAIAFGFSNPEERHRLLVYDLGGGTFDVSIIQMINNNYSVMEIQGDNFLGGDDFDAAIVKRVVEAVRQDHGFDLLSHPSSLWRVKQEAEAAKKALSTASATRYLQTLHSIPEVGTIDLDLELSRQHFEADIRPHLKKTMDLVSEAMKRQSLKPKDFTGVLLVGGSTSIPMVHTMLSEIFGEEKIRRTINPMECVALGAAIRTRSYKLESNRKSVETDIGRIQRVTALPLGIAAVEGDDVDVFVSLIEKGTPYPMEAPKKKIFRPSENNQKLLRIPILEGVHRKASINEQQGVVEIPLDQGIDVSQPIEISFEYDKDRMLTVNVHLVGTDKRWREVVHRDRARPSGDDDGKTIQDHFGEELKPAIASASRFLESFGAYMKPSDRASIEAYISDGKTALSNNDETAGAAVTAKLDGAIMGSGVASLMFIAEAYMQRAPPHVQRVLADAIARLREAYQRGDDRQIGEIATNLRMAIANLEAQHRPETIGDAANQGLVRHTRDGG